MCPALAVAGIVPAAVYDVGGFLGVLAYLGLFFLPPLWLGLWFGVARREAIDTHLRAAERALAATRDLQPAVSAARIGGDRLSNDPSGFAFLDPLPTVRQQVRALTTAAHAMGLNVPDEPANQKGWDLGTLFRHG
jgi:hypothetical protein